MENVNIKVKNDSVKLKMISENKNNTIIFHFDF